MYVSVYMRQCVFGMVVTIHKNGYSVHHIGRGSAEVEECLVDRKLSVVRIWWMFVLRLCRDCNWDELTIGLLLLRLVLFAMLFVPLVDMTAIKMIILFASN